MRFPVAGAHQFLQNIEYVIVEVVEHQAHHNWRASFQHREGSWSRCVWQCLSCNEREYRRHCCAEVSETAEHMGIVHLHWSDAKNQRPRYGKQLKLCIRNFAIYNHSHLRIEQLLGFMDISSAIIAPNASIFVTEFSQFGSLLDINNRIRQATTKVSSCAQYMICDASLPLSFTNMIRYL